MVKSTKNCAPLLNRPMEISIREFLERLIEERDRLYEAKFRALEVEFRTAITALEKSTQAAFSSSEKAIVKAEEAQREYNIRSNEFRGQLDDQAKLLIPRSEVGVLLKGLDDRIGEINKKIVDFMTRSEMIGMLDSNEEKSDSRFLGIQKDMDNIRQDVIGLREFRGSNVGKESAFLNSQVKNHWLIGVMISVLFSGAALALAVYNSFIKVAK
jgi:hypothetical protein